METPTAFHRSKGYMHIYISLYISMSVSVCKVLWRVMKRISTLSFSLRTWNNKCLAKTNKKTKKPRTTGVKVYIEQVQELSIY